jgi:hypothetical protein
MGIIWYVIDVVIRNCPLGGHLVMSSGCHLALTSDVVVWCCHLALSSGLKSELSSAMSSLVVIWVVICVVISQSFCDVIWCCHMVLPTGAVI